jgi:YjjG family noncanonical pyrimidine nucleotidase
MYDTIKHIFFDLDHTLWDFDKNSEIAFQKIFNQLFPEILISDFIKVYAPNNQACWKLYQNNEITHEQLRYKRLRDTFNQLQIQVSDKGIHSISEQYIILLPESNFLFEGCVETLHYLQQKYTLHIITNGFAEVQFLKLNNSGIHHFFETITNSEMAGAKKPHAKIFEHALSVANAKKTESIMIGDCLDADVGGAIQFGMKAIFFNPNLVETDNAIEQITKLDELKKLL